MIVIVGAGICGLGIGWRLVQAGRAVTVFDRGEAGMAATWAAAGMLAPQADHAQRLSDNEEVDDAPISAHVQRTAQESFEPEAFVVRRSMPWADAGGEGLMFVAFGDTLNSFEAQLLRMIGHEDQVIDGLFRFTRPISGSYFWCPPVIGGKIDLTALGL